MWTEIKIDEDTPGEGVTFSQETQSSIDPSHKLSYLIDALFLARPWSSFGTSFEHLYQSSSWHSLLTASSQQTLLVAWQPCFNNLCRWNGVQAQRIGQTTAGVMMLSVFLHTVHLHQHHILLACLKHKADNMISLSAKHPLV